MYYSAGNFRSAVEAQKYLKLLIPFFYSRKKGELYFLKRSLGLRPIKSDKYKKLRWEIYHSPVTQTPGGPLPPFEIENFRQRAEAFIAGYKKAKRSK